MEKYSRPGELPGDKIIRHVLAYLGASTKNRRAELGALIARGVDKPEEAVEIKTNCGMFALGIFAEVGVDSPVLQRRYVTGMAITWLRQIGIERKALVQYTGPHGPQPKVGSLLRYRTTHPEPLNDDHVEFLVTLPDANGYADRAGGGGHDNLISHSRADAPHNGGLITYNFGRPLIEFWDPDLLGIEVIPAGSDINEAYPE